MTNVQGIEHVNGWDLYRVEYKNSARAKKPHVTNFFAPDGETARVYSRRYLLGTIDGVVVGLRLATTEEAFAMVEGVVA